MFSITKLAMFSALGMAIVLAAFFGMSGGRTAHADCSPFLVNCYNLGEQSAKLKQVSVQYNPVRYRLNLTPSAKILSPANNATFNVPNSYGTAQIAFEGKGNGASGWYTGFDNTTGTGLWWTASSFRGNVDYGQGSQVTMDLHAGQYGCSAYTIELEVWENYTTVANDVIGVYVCVE